MTEIALDVLDWASDRFPVALFFIAGFALGMIFESWLVLNGLG